MEGKGLDPHVKSVKKKRLPRLHKKQLLLTIVLLLVVGGAAAYYFLNRKDEKKVVNNQCSTQFVQDTVLRDAAIVIPGNKPEEMKKMVESIQKIPGYENDANCLYPIVKYNLLIGNAPDARANYNKMVKVYDQQKGLLAIFGPGAEKPDQLKALVEVAEKQKTEAGSNVFYGPEVEQ